MKYDKEEYMSALLTSARDSGQVFAHELTEPAFCGDLSDEQIRAILDELRECRTDVVPGGKFVPGKHELRELLREIRECPAEKESFAGRTKNEDPIRLYFDELSQLDPPDPRMERDLVCEAAEGNDEATGRLIELCMYIPVTAAFGLIGKNALFSDLVQEGNMELMAAADEFDYGSGWSFSGYAALRVGRYLYSLTADQPETVRLPTGLAEDIVKILRRKGQMKKEGGEPTAAAIAAAEGISEERVEKALEALKAAGGENAASQQETETEPKKSEAEQQLSAQVAQLLAALPEMEAQVLEMRYGIGGASPLSEKETAERLSISEEEVKKLEAAALSHLGS